MNSESDVILPNRIDQNDINVGIRHLRIDEQFSRESANTELLSKDIPKTVFIIGLGGIGAWVATYIGSMNRVTNIILIDPDVIEMSNLNRTPFEYNHVNELKVTAAAEMIVRRNVQVNVFPINKYFNRDLVDEFREGNLLAQMLAGNNESMISSEIRSILFIDCRDNYYADYDLFNEVGSIIGSSRVIKLRAAYNETQITLDFQPELHPVMGAGGYAVAPSSVIPAALVALFVCIMAGQYMRNLNGNTQIFKNPLTFNVENILDIMFAGNYILNKIEPCRLKDEFNEMMNKGYCNSDQLIQYQDTEQGLPVNRVNT
jgi:hypothetical protein